MCKKDTLTEGRHRYLPLGNFINDVSTLKGDNSVPFYLFGSILGTHNVGILIQILKS